MLGLTAGITSALNHERDLAESRPCPYLMAAEHAPVSVAYGIRSLYWNTVNRASGNSLRPASEDVGVDSDAGPVLEVPLTRSRPSWKQGSRDKDSRVAIEDAARIQCSVRLQECHLYRVVPNEFLPSCMVT